MENLLKRVLRFRHITLTDSSTSHKDLLDLAVEHKILNYQLAEDLDEYRAFRHFFVHGYGIAFQEVPLKPLAQKLPELWRRFITELEANISAQRPQNPSA
jgi:uncharacterized protein YutE (UPF0331/DUF86 family)